MKKIISIFLLIALILTLVACKKEKQPTYFAPIADWQQAYIDAEHLSENKLTYFRNQLTIGNDAHYVLWNYLIDGCDYDITRNGDAPVEFSEGKLLAKNEYVLVTQDLMVGYTPIAIHFTWIDEKMEIIEVVLVTTNDAAIEGVDE